MGNVNATRKLSMVFIATVSVQLGECFNFTGLIVVTVEFNNVIIMY